MSNGSTRRAKANQVVRPGTCTRARSIVVCIAVRRRTRVLKHLRVRRRRACLRRRVVVGAAKFRPIEGGAGTLAGHDGARIGHL